MIDWSFVLTFLVLVGIALALCVIAVFVMEAIKCFFQWVDGRYARADKHEDEEDGQYSESETTCEMCDADPTHDYVEWNQDRTEMKVSYWCDEHKPDGALPLEEVDPYVVFAAVEDLLKQSEDAKANGRPVHAAVLLDTAMRILKRHSPGYISQTDLGRVIGSMYLEEKINGERERKEFS